MQSSEVPKFAARYRRAFDWRLSTSDRGSIKTACAAFAALSDKENAEILEDFLETSRKRRNNRRALAKLQLNLLDELIETEQALKYYREKRQELAEALAGPIAEEARTQVCEGIEALERETFFHRAYSNCIRAIGDGIAWRALEYDRAAIRVLCQNANKPNVLSEGTAEELREWSRTFSRGDGLAILNSLTNCLTIGDITVVRGDGSAEIVEVKSSTRTSGRLTRQKQRMRETVELIKSGEGEFEGEKVDFVRLDILPENGLDIVAGLLEQARKAGFAARRVSNFLHVECVYVPAIKELDLAMSALSAFRERESGDWIASNDLVVDLSTMDVIAFTPNCAPLSVFPFDSRTCVELLTATSAYRVSFNLTELEREFKRAGWVIDKTPQQVLDEEGNLGSAIMVVSKGGFHSTVAPADVMRLKIETVRPRVVVRELEMLRDLGPGSGPEKTLVVFDGEGQIWN
jgi:hypothetical protein